MAIASRVKRYLESRDFPYEELPHARTSTSLQSAKAVNVWPEFVAKAVVLEDADGYLVAVLPASDHISLSALREALGRQLEFAGERELKTLFRDCETGAVPPLGTAYGIPIVMDESLLALPTVYFEAGDHKDLVAMDGDDFSRLMSDASCCRFAFHH